MTYEAAVWQFNMAKPTAGDAGDSRFDAVRWDPRFQRFPKAKKHVEIDKRFQGMFSDPAFQQGPTVDKRGRKIVKNKNREDMHKYYKLRDQAGAGEQQEQKGQAAQEAEASAPVQTPEASKPSKAAKAQTSVLGKRKKGNAADEEPVAAPPERLDLMAAGAEEQVSSASEGGQDNEDSDAARAAERWARVRGLAGPAESSSDEESSDEGPPQQESEEVGNLAEWGVGAMAANPDEAIPVSDETRRLAVVDLDWDRIKAVDILVVLRSFAGQGRVERVTVYPSDFGLQRMAEEASMGPQALFGRSNVAEAHAEPSAAPAAGRGQEEGGSGSDSDWTEDEQAALELEDAGGDGQDPVSSESDSGDDVRKRKLQLYERSRLRYYYAIVDCADVATAARLYDECDGLEFLRSACKFDLRFVPDEQSFEARQQRDRASEVPPDYKAPDFTTSALQHTNVKLSWDAGDDERKRVLQKRLNDDAIKENDFKAYLGSSSDDGEAAQDMDASTSLQERYRKLLLSGSGTSQAAHGGKTWGAQTEEDSKQGSDQERDQPDGNSDEEPAQPRRGDVDMEVTFTPGLEGLGARLLAQSRDQAARKDETVWQSYLRRQKEKKQLAKARGRKHVSSDESDDSGQAAGSDGLGSQEHNDPFFQREDDVFRDPFFNDGSGAMSADAASGKAAKGAKQTGGQKADAKLSARVQRAAEKQRQAELELLLMDDTALGDVARGGDKQAVLPADTEDGELADRKPRPGSKAMRRERIKQKREAKRLERQAGSDDEDVAGPNGQQFALDTQDSRFQGLFSSPDFALDPTDPRFKRLKSTGAVSKISEERQKRGQHHPTAAQAALDADETGPADRPSAPGTGQAGSNRELTAMVSGLKRKAASRKAAEPVFKQPKRKHRPM